MSRRNALNRFSIDAQDPVASIPLAQAKKRNNRSWDHSHPVTSYYIPIHLRVHAKQIGRDVLALSQKYMTSITSVATALVSYSLTHVRQGKLLVEARPSAKTRKMILVWDESEHSIKQDIPEPLETNSNQDEKDFYLGYRWAKEIDLQIKALADGISVGEVVVFLLRYALDAYQAGHLILREETIVVAQKVMASW